MDTQSLVLTAAGEIMSAEVLGIDNLYCKYFYVKGKDWAIVSGIEEGTTQICRKGGKGVSSAVWNFPLEISFKTSNPFGWPQLVVCVYGSGFGGRDVIVGYGWTHLPTVAGRYTRDIRIFRPQSSSFLQEIISIVSGRLPEFRDPRFVAKGESRENGGIDLKRPHGLFSRRLTAHSDLIPFSYPHCQYWHCAREA